MLCVTQIKMLSATATLLNNAFFHSPKTKKNSYGNEHYLFRLSTYLKVSIFLYEIIIHINIDISYSHTSPIHMSLLKGF